MSSSSKPGKGYCVRSAYFLALQICHHLLAVTDKPQRVCELRLFESVRQQEDILGIVFRHQNRQIQVNFFQSPDTLPAFGHRFKRFVVRQSLLRLPRPLDPHLNRIKRFARRDEQSLLVLSAKTHVPRPIFMHRNVPQPLPGLVEHRHPVAGQVQIPLVVDGHAVRAKLADQALVRQRAVRLRVISPRPARADVRQV